MRVIGGNFYRAFAQACQTYLRAVYGVDLPPTADAGFFILVLKSEPAPKNSQLFYFFYVVK